MLNFLKEFWLLSTLNGWISCWFFCCIRLFSIKWVDSIRIYQGLQLARREGKWARRAGRARSRIEFILNRIFKTWEWTLLFLLSFDYRHTKKLPFLFLYHKLTLSSVYIIIPLVIFKFFFYQTFSWWSFRIQFL